MTNQHLQQLKHLQALAVQADYRSTLLEQAAGAPLDILSVFLDEEDDEHLDLVFFPESAGLDGSDFLQFYYQYPFTLSESGNQAVIQILPHINNRLSLGHLSINFGEARVQFKYVLALPLSASLDVRHFNDILDMCIHAPALFGKIIHDLGAEQISLEQAFILLNEIQ